MKYASILVIFIAGIAIGRWSVLRNEADATVPSQIETAPVEESSSAGVKRPLETPISNPSSKPSEETQSLSRTDLKVRDKQARELFDQLIEAREKDNLEEQNRLFAKLESLDSKHEKFFEAKAMFLQDDDDWDGAHKVLKECVAVIPTSAYCLRRLTNIRSSTNEDKLRYGYKCLQVSKNDPLCLVDVAMALSSKGDYAKAKEYLEIALSAPQGSEGYDRPYILFQYGLVLENLHFNQKAKEAFSTACRLNMKQACQKLQ